jgi:hypothetical protein
LRVLRLGGRGIALVVFLDELDLAPRRLVVDLLERHLKAVQHVLAGGGEDTGDRTEIADADGVGGASGNRAEQEQQTDNGGGASHHGVVS